MKYLYLIVGRSGSGKTYLAEALAKHYNGKILESYTTRPKREPNEKGHIFVDKEAYLKAKAENIIIAETLFADNYYWATTEQINDTDFYVIDPKGVEDVLNAYKNKQIDKEPFIIGLDITKEEAKKRMINRGDNNHTIEKRLENDDKIFQNFSYNTLINANKSKEEVLNIVINRIDKTEKGKYL